MRPSRVRPIADPDLPRREWRVEVNGKELVDPRLVELVHPRIGTLTYGWTPGGYDGWCFHEHRGGGAVTVPFARSGETLVVGVIREERFNQGGVVLNVPRGFLELGEAHRDAASRELSEETSLGDLRVFPLIGAALNPNSSFFDTSGLDEGVRVFACEVPSGWLVTDGAGLAVRDECLDGSVAAQIAKTREKIGALRFLPWREAVALGDMFTVAAVARLVVHVGT
jgi:ADP-ribose pyrophosphatase YjhB (NUDIX family)